MSIILVSDTKQTIPVSFINNRFFSFCCVSRVVHWLPECLVTSWHLSLSLSTQLWRIFPPFLLVYFVAHQSNQLQVAELHLEFWTRLNSSFLPRRVGPGVGVQHFLQAIPGLRSGCTVRAATGHCGGWIRSPSWSAPGGTDVGRARTGRSGDWTGAERDLPPVLRPPRRKQNKCVGNILNRKAEILFLTFCD